MTRNVNVAVASVMIAVAAAVSGCVPVFFGGVAAESVSVATERRTVGSQVSDTVIESRVAMQIGEKIESADRHITVTSFNGKVLLTGEVRTAGMKQTAEDVARSSLEVESVVNEIAVQDPSSISQRMSDSALATKVRSRIIGTKGTYLNQMKVVVDRGIVYLMGMVTQEEGAKAADTASNTSGVDSVVKVYEYMTVEEIAARMKAMSSSGSSTQGSESNE